MSEKVKAERPGTRPSQCRNGKIARLPHGVREQLNQRLRDGESGRSLVKWLNDLPEVKAALQREFDGCAIMEQNLSEWRQGGFRDWMAKAEADEWMADTLTEGPPCRAVSRRKGSRTKDVEMESVSDRVAGWFFPHYVAAARGQLAAARTSAERWSVLRTICADLAGLRRSDHYVERLRIWREKLRAETAEENKITEKDFLKWARAQPDVEKLIWPDRERLTPEEKQQRIREILGTGDPVEINQPCATNEPNNPTESH
jgi:hypothetical protein